MTFTIGGWRSGREWKVVQPLTTGLDSSANVWYLNAPGERAIVNDTAPFRCPTSGTSALTLTLSPAANGLAGTKLAPSPSECALIVPAWTLVFEPTTFTPRQLVGATPRKLISLWAEASGVPANG